VHVFVRSSRSSFAEFNDATCASLLKHGKLLLNHVELPKQWKLMHLGAAMISKAREGNYKQAWEVMMRSSKDPLSLDQMLPDDSGAEAMVLGRQLVKHCYNKLPGDGSDKSGSVFRAHFAEVLGEALKSDLPEIVLSQCANAKQLLFFDQHGHGGGHGLSAAVSSMDGADKETILADFIAFPQMTPVLENARAHVKTELQNGSHKKLLEDALGMCSVDAFKVSSQFETPWTKGLAYKGLAHCKASQYRVQGTPSTSPRDTCYIVATAGCTISWL
jgi:hypothetical protein